MYQHAARYRIWILIIAWLIPTTQLTVGSDDTQMITEENPNFSVEDLDFFERRVRPLLAEHCYACHSAQAKKLAGSLRLDSRETLLAGGDTGAAVVPGKPEQSLIIDAIRYGDLYQMPPKSQLPSTAIETLVEWVARGAPWPQDEAIKVSMESKSFDLLQRRDTHWAWHPVADAQAPPVNDTSWPRSSIDHFILAKLETHHLHPAADANPYTLVRRAYFDLIGLPPTPEQVQAFVANPSTNAWTQLVDHLLEQPQFGERWARHWLDLMRYAETRGHEFDFDIPNAWQYRDYVIRAFNADVPYDQWVTEHIAGDLLEHPRHHPLRGFNESVLATGFWYLGEWVHSPVDILQDEADRLDNAIDVFSKAFLGLTVSCARCHDHKFDAISQRDYYALVGYLQSSSYHQVRFESHEQNLRVAQQFDQLRRETGCRVATHIAARCAAQGEPFDKLLHAASQWVRQGSKQPILHKLATQADLPVETLRQWGMELALAVDDQQHPLHGLGLAAVGQPAATGERPLAETNGSTAKGHPGDSLWDAYQVVANFDDRQTPWMVDGPAFGDGPVCRGELLAGTSVDAPIAEIVSFGRAQLRPRLAQLTLAPGTVRDPGTLSQWSERSGRTLRTPTVELTTGKLYYLLRGGAQVHAVVDSHRLIHGPLHGSLLKVVPDLNAWRWVEHDLTPYQTHGAHIEFSPHQDDPLELAMVLQGNTLPGYLPTTLNCNLKTFPASSTALSELSRQYATLLREALDQLATGQLTMNERADSSSHRHLAAWVAAHPQLWAGKSDQVLEQLLADADIQRDKILQSLRTQSATAPAIWDGTGVDQRLFIRGNPLTPGPKIPRQLLSAIVGDSQPAPIGGSGRLELARRLVEPSNPLTARVMANRIWQHLLGRGVVPTVDNFGVLGHPPTHPELLDYLATLLVHEDWSLKRLIRTIMLSRTYRMSSQASPQAIKIDPTNQWFHHRPLRRLEAESIRDAMVTVSGQLAPQLYGPSVPIHLSPFMQGRGRPKVQGPLDGSGRRTIYLAVRRNFLSPMMLAFDTPQPARPMGRRNQSNVPAQALIMMNDPLVIQQAGNFAKRLLQGEADPNRRIDQLYLRTLSRPPQAPERAAVHHFLTQKTAAVDADQGENLTEEAIWTDLCQVMFNLKEFIYLE